MLRTLMALSLALTPALALAQASRTAALPPARVADMTAPPGIILPASSAGLDLCIGTGSAAGANSMLAFTLSGPVRDSDCTDARLSKWAWDSGHVALSYQIGCASRVWREADAVTERRCIPQPRPWWRFW